MKAFYHNAPAKSIEVFLPFWVLFAFFGKKSLQKPSLGANVGDLRVSDEKIALHVAAQANDEKRRQLEGALQNSGSGQRIPRTDGNADTEAGAKKRGGEP